MYNFVINNLATILVGTAVATLIILVTVKMIRDKKNGKSSCGGNCANCPSGKIHPVK